MNENIYQTIKGSVKSIYFGKKNLILSTEMVEQLFKFSERYKYPGITNQLIEIRFDEIKKIFFLK